MHTNIYIYCDTLERLDPVKAVRAIHQAWLQMRALDANIDCAPYDNAPALQALHDCLRDAGHPAGGLS